MQQKLGDRKLQLKKVKGTDNTADLQTKYLSAKDVERIMAALGFVATAGSSAAALKANV